MSKQCQSDATFRYIWPGKGDSFCCAEHGLGINKVAQAIGCPVHFYPITPDFCKDGWPQCRSFVNEELNHE